MIASLGELLRWTAEMPAEFQSEHAGWPGGTVRVRAVVADVHEGVTRVPAAADLRAAMDASDTSRKERNRLRWLLAAAHVLWHPALRTAGPSAAPGLRRLLLQELPAVAAVSPVESLAQEEDRREELIRLVLRAVGALVEGESAAESEDRLRQVESVERHRVLAESAERERRSRSVREAMAKKAAEEAAAKASRE